MFPEAESTFFLTVYIASYIKGYDEFLVYMHVVDVKFNTVPQFINVRFLNMKVDTGLSYTYSIDCHLQLTTRENFILEEVLLSYIRGETHKLKFTIVTSRSHSGEKNITPLLLLKCEIWGKYKQYKTKKKIKDATSLKMGNTIINLQISLKFVNMHNSKIRRGEVLPNTNTCVEINTFWKNIVH